MLRELRSWPMLDGYRGAAPLNVSALCGIVAKISALAIAEPMISELDLNPVIVRADGEGCVAVDARIITSTVPVATHQADSRPEAPPGAQAHRCRGRV